MSTATRTPGATAATYIADNPATAERGWDLLDRLLDHFVEYTGPISTAGHRRPTRVAFLTRMGVLTSLATHGVA